MSGALTILTQGFHRTYVLLLHPAADSFNVLAAQGNDGTWQESYTHHLVVKQQMRKIVSLSSLGVVAAGALASHYILNWLV